MAIPEESFADVSVDPTAEHSESMTRLVAARGSTADQTFGKGLKHAAPCTYHVTDPVHSDVVSTNAAVSDVATHRREAERQLLRNNYAAALDAMTRALRLETSARNEALYAWLLHLSAGGVGGRAHPRAWQHLESALRRDPDSEDAHFYHAMLLKHAGRDDEACEAFRRVVRINPKNRAAQRELRLWDMRRRTESRPSLFDRALGRKPT